MTRTTRYASPSTSGVNHDSANLITEAIMINRHGYLPPGVWRKGQPLKNEWGQVVVKVKRIIKTCKIDDRRLAWYVKRFHATDLDYEEFGLLRWKINQYFKWYKLDWFAEFYAQLQAQAVAKSSEYVENTTGYKTKDMVPKKRPSLRDILEELENE